MQRKQLTINLSSSIILSTCRVARSLRTARGLHDTTPHLNCEPVRPTFPSAAPKLCPSVRSVVRAHGPHAVRPTCPDGNPPRSACPRYQARPALCNPPAGAALLPASFSSFRFRPTPSFALVLRCGSLSSMSLHQTPSSLPTRILSPKGRVSRG